MSALVLTDGQVRLVQILIVVILIAGFTGIALVSVLGAGLRQHTSPTAPMPFYVAPDADPFECPRCGGSGVVDIDDDWQRPFIHDAECPRCGGTGRVEEVA